MICRKHGAQWVIALVGYGANGFDWEGWSIDGILSSCPGKEGELGCRI